MSLLIAKFAKKSHIEATVFFIFLTNGQRQT